MTQPGDDARPGILAPPPLIFGLALGCGIALDHDFSAATPRARLDRVLGMAAIAAGGALGATAFAEFRRGATTPNPYAPTRALVTGGPFRWTRNPLYVGATAVYVGASLAASSLRALTFLPIALAVLDRVVVEPEERYLEGRFGDAYRAYRARVPRWF